MKFATTRFVLIFVSLFSTAWAQDIHISMAPPTPSPGDTVTFTLDGGVDNAGNLAALFFGESESTRKLFALGYADSQGIFMFSYPNLPEELAGRTFETLGYILQPGEGIQQSNTLLWFVSSGTITPVIAATRQSGVAPLAVFFDGIDSQGLSGGDFVGADFAWDYDKTGQDPGHSFNRTPGFVSAHVFEEPGTYTVGVRVTDTAGNTGAAFTEITVEDPEVAYQSPQGETYCVSKSGDFSGCPTSDPAYHVTTSNLDNAMDLLDSHVRVLLRRGETWTPGSEVVVQNVQGPAHLGAFPDPGDIENPLKPRIRSLRNEEHSYILRFEFCHDVRLQGLEIEGNYPAGAGTKGIKTRRGSNLLFDRLDVSQIRNGFNVDESDGGAETTDGVFLTNNTIHTIHDYGFFGSGYHLATINNSMDTFLDNEHGIRVAGGNRSFHYKNHIVDTPLEKTAIAIRGQGNVGSNRHVAVIGNRVDNSMQAGPSNDTVFQTIEHVLFENNVCVRRPGVYITGIAMVGNDLMARGNIMHGYESVFSARSHPLMPGSDNIRILYNTVIFPSTIGFGGVFLKNKRSNTNVTVKGNISMYLGNLSGNQFLRSDAPANQIHSEDNLLYAPQYGNWKAFKIDGTSYSLSEWQAAHGQDQNTVRANPLLLSVDPVHPDFAVPGPGSPAINAGMYWIPLLLDAFGNPRSVGHHDKGAVEAQ